VKAFTFSFFIFYVAIVFGQPPVDDTDTLYRATKQEGLSPDRGHIQLNGSVQQKKRRTALVAGVHGLAYSGTLIMLSETWYSDFPRTSFHTFNDSREWLQMDKIGHAWTSYNIAQYSTGLWSWAGLNKRQAVLLGSVSSIGFQTILEYLDAHSSEWGWSWADVTANVAGTTIYAAQELAWQTQKLRIKFSAHPVRYSADLRGRTDSLFGASTADRVLKDYNAQTYWLSANLRTLTRSDIFPAWLGVAVGHGAKGVYGGFSNIGRSKGGEIIFSRPDIKRQRQWYLSPDIDFTKIKTEKKGLKTVFHLLNMIKIPAPALELSGGKLKTHLLYF
jgi:uncharacterized protein YfiM (DUF2279 family)